MRDVVIEISIPTEDGNFYLKYLDMFPEYLIESGENQFFSENVYALQLFLHQENRIYQNFLFVLLRQLQHVSLL